MRIPDIIPRMLKIATFLSLPLLCLAGHASAQDDSGIDPEALIERILTVEKTTAADAA